MMAKKAKPMYKAYKRQAILTVMVMTIYNFSIEHISLID